MGTEALPPVTLNGFPNKSLYIQTTIKSISLKISVMDISIRLFWSWVPMKIIDFSFLNVSGHHSVVMKFQTEKKKQKEIT